MDCFHRHHGRRLSKRAATAKPPRILARPTDYRAGRAAPAASARENEGASQLYSLGIYYTGENCAGLHQSRGYLSGECGAAAGGRSCRFWLGVISVPEPGFSGAVLRVRGLRGFSTGIIITGIILATQRVTNSHAAN